MLVGTIALLNLGLLVVILRRWQELEVVRRRDDFVAQGPQPGDRLPEFAATAISGRTVTQDDFRSGGLLLGVFSHDCPSCVDKVPVFAEQAERIRESGGRVMALLMGAEAGESGLTAALIGPADEIVPEPEASPLFKALRVPGYPTILTYQGGVLAATSAVARQPVPAAS
ncbi:redoxin domain-containing protein [Yinghuangia seranimata]|uniref:redoxin domain-containing protein n=1 Tax=Yinghuangia seranimata TaxID=408067 RepID=UPI00248B6680|nr:redoxin domain-containing protein [Yinghuangia seranimata]MDI2128477.1 redoxin domain-containing protein [Yinghuangia seranimata]